MKGKNSGENRCKWQVVKVSTSKTSTIRFISHCSLSNVKYDVVLVRLATWHFDCDFCCGNCFRYKCNRNFQL